MDEGKNSMEANFREEAVSLCGKSRRGLLLYRIFVIIMGIFVISLIVWDGFFLTDGEDHLMGLLVTFLLFCVGMMIGLLAANCRRMRKAWAISPRVLHDYCALKLERLRSKKPSAGNDQLFIMAKCSIYEGRLAEAAEELNRVDYYGMPAAHQAAYHMMWAIIHLLGGQQAEYEQNLDVYRQILLSQGKRLPKGEQRLQVLMSQDRQRVLELVDLTEDLRLSAVNMVNWSGCFFSLALLGFLLIGQDLLPAGLEYRSWFQIAAWAVPQIAFGVFGIRTLISQYRMRRAAGRSGAAWLAWGCILLVILFLFFAGRDLLGLASWGQERRLDDGTLLVSEPHLLDATTYYICEPVGPFLRQYSHALDTTEEEQTELEVEWTGAAPSDERKEQLYQSIYDTQLADAYPGGMEFYSGAKGERYAVLSDTYETSFQGESVTAQLRLVYDRESENGACYEVVCYEDHYDADGNMQDNTSIVDIYAVVKESGEVISSGRTGWADVGNEEYRRATGE